MTKHDATRFLMGFLLGATYNERLAKKFKTQSRLLRHALNSGLHILQNQEQGFFNSLERVVREELEAAKFEGDYN